MPEEFEPTGAPEQKSGFGLFGKPKEPAAASPAVSELTDKINNLAARLRISEERYGELRKKLTLIEQNMLVHGKKSNTDIKAIDSEITEIKHSITEVEDRILTIIKELRLTAKKEDVGVMKRYVELWDPTKFVTVDTVEKIVKELLGKPENGDENSEETEE